MAEMTGQCYRVWQKTPPFYYQLSSVGETSIRILDFVIAAGFQALSRASRLVF